VDLLDLSYLEDVLTRDEAEAILRKHTGSRAERKSILQSGYPGYDTSVGWFQYEDSQVRDLARQAMDKGFHAFKLKLGRPTASVTCVAPSCCANLPAQML